MSMQFGGGAGTLELPMNSKRTVGRTSSHMSIPDFCKLTSSMLKPHRTLPSLWCSVIIELYRFFSEPTVSSFVFIAVPVIAP